MDKKNIRVVALVMMEDYSIIDIDLFFDEVEADNAWEDICENYDLDETGEAFDGNATLIWQETTINIEKLVQKGETK